MSIETINLLFLPGDTPGHDMLREVKKVVDWFNRNTHLSFHVDEGDIGLDALKAHGTPYPRATQVKAKNAHGILVGCVTGHSWVSDEHSAPTPRDGMVAMKEDLGFYVRLRPVFTFDSLLSLSPLKAHIAEGMDLLVVRDFSGSVYRGPHGIEGEGGQKHGFHTLDYTLEQVTHVAETAFEVAQRRNYRITTVGTAAPLESMRIWREAVENVAKAYPHVETEHRYVEDVARLITSKPSAFDILLTPNFMGSFLSDITSGLTGTATLLPTASLAQQGRDGITPGVYEPAYPHSSGSPIAAIASFAMLLKHTLDERQQALKLQHAVIRALTKGYRTEDIRQDSMSTVDSIQMGNAIVDELNQTLRS